MGVKSQGIEGPQLFFFWFLVFGGSLTKGYLRGQIGQLWDQRRNGFIRPADLIFRPGGQPRVQFWNFCVSVNVCVCVW